MIEVVRYVRKKKIWRCDCCEITALDEASIRSHAEAAHRADLEKPLRYCEQCRECLVADEAHPPEHPVRPGTEHMQIAYARGAARGRADGYQRGRQQAILAGIAAALTKH